MSSWKETFPFFPTLPETFSLESTEIEGSDGGPLRLDVYEARDPGGEARDRTAAPSTPVILFHGFRAYRDWGFLPLLASRLAEAGFTAISFSASGSGVRDPGGAFVERERFRRNTYARELADIARVVDWALSRVGPHEAARGGAREGASWDAPAEARGDFAEVERKAGLVGHSRGGTLALLHAASDPRVGCLATLASPSRLGIWEPRQTEAWERGEDSPVYDFRTRTRLPLGPDLWTDFTSRSERYDVPRAVESLRVPLLIVQGSRDKVVAPDHARAIAAHADPTRTEIRIIEGAGHSFQAGDRIRRTPPQLLDMVEAVTAWMRRWLSKRLS